MAKVTLYLRFETSRGERSFARPVASNGKPLTDTGIPKPLYAFVNGRAEHHPEGQYFLRYTQNGKRMWENVGSDCWVVLDKKAWWGTVAPSMHYLEADRRFQKVIPISGGCRAHWTFGLRANH